MKTLLFITMLLCFSLSYAHDIDIQSDCLFHDSGFVSTSENKTPTSLLKKDEDDVYTIFLSGRSEFEASFENKTPSHLPEDKISSKLEFTKPGDKTIRLINDLDDDITLESTFLAGNQFSIYPAARSISMHGLAACAKISAGESCTFKVNAAENASASIDPEGSQFFITYSVDAKGISRLNKFTVKIDYNKDVGFKVRNLKFTDKKFANELINITPTPLSSTKKLTIVNNNPASTVTIKNIQLAQKKAGITIGDYRDCLNLKGKSSCEVDITVSHEAEDDATPIYVTYDTDDGKKDIVATAAIIISQDSNKDKTDLGTAVKAGLALSTYLNLQKLILGKLPKMLGNAIRIGTAYKSTKFYNPLENHYIKPKSYESSYLPNQLTEDATKTIVGGGFKMTGDITGYYLSKFACATMANYITTEVTNLMFSSKEYLPEEDGFLSAIVKSTGATSHKKAISFGMKTILRTGCLAVVNLATGIPQPPDVSIDFAVDMATLVQVGNAIDNINAASSDPDADEWYLITNL